MEVMAGIAVWTVNGAKVSEYPETTPFALLPKIRVVELEIQIWPLPWKKGGWSCGCWCGGGRNDEGGGCCGFMSSDLSSHQKWILSAPLTSLVISPPTTVSYSLFCTAVHFLTCKMRRKRRKNRGQGVWAGGGVSARGLVDRKTFVSLCNVTFNQFYLHWAFCPSRENLIRF